MSVLMGSGPVQHVELDESPGEDDERPDDAHGHEHAEQDVVQHHGNELPLLGRLRGGRGRGRGRVIIQEL